MASLLVMTLIFYICQTIYTIFLSYHQCSKILLKSFLIKKCNLCSSKEQDENNGTFRPIL